MTLKDCLHRILIEYVIKSDLPATSALTIGDIEALTDYLFSSGVIPTDPNQIYVPDWTGNTVPPSAGKNVAPPTMEIKTADILPFTRRPS